MVVLGGVLPAGILTARAPSPRGAAMRVWPALPSPGQLVRLPLPCPPQLIELSGYTGGGRLAARWWSPFSDQLMICDGTLTETGRWRGWLCFSEHPLARLFLEPYRLGDSDDEGEHRLLVDRHLGTLDVGLARDVEQLLATQPSELHALSTDLSAGETEALLKRLLDVHGERERANSPQQLHAEVRVVWQREHELLDQLTALLDDAQTALCEALRSCGARMPAKVVVMSRRSRKCRRDDASRRRRRARHAGRRLARRTRGGDRALRSGGGRSLSGRASAQSTGGSTRSGRVLIIGGPVSRQPPAHRRAALRRARPAQLARTHVRALRQPLRGPVRVPMLRLVCAP